MKSPVFSAEEQERAIAAILDEMKIEGLTANFLKLIARNRRLFAAPDMIKRFPRPARAPSRPDIAPRSPRRSSSPRGQVAALQTALKAALRKDVQLDQQG